MLKKETGLYDLVFPGGLKGYSDKGLWEIYDKLGVEIHNRGIEKEMNKNLLEVITNSEDYNEFMHKAGENKALSSFSIHELTDAWNEYWDGMKDEQVENEIDDFRMKEEDFVK